MSRPIRCYTCSKVLGNKYENFDTYKDKTQAFIDLKIERYCCKRMLLTSIDTYDLFKHYTLENIPKQVIVKTEQTSDRIYNAR